MSEPQATRPFCYAKIHRCTVTDANLDYEGSITIDAALLRVAGIYPYTRVDVVNLANGARLQTYVIEGAAQSGVICLNGAAAHHFAAGDLAIVMAYEDVPVDRLPGRRHCVIKVDAKNRITAIDSHVTPAIETLPEPTPLDAAVAARIPAEA